jgi:L-alanine-DL-glutamate epimerase-like enolase superfamily enzyme
VPNTFLWLDANGYYDVATALHLAPKFADLGADVWEQPIAPNRLTGLRELKKQGALPIIFDEGVVSSVELVEFIKLGLLDGNELDEDLFERMLAVTPESLKDAA